MKSILHDSFHYTPSTKTDLKKTFARIRREQRIRERLQADAEVEARSKVVTIKLRKTDTAELAEIASSTS